MYIGWRHAAWFILAICPPNLQAQDCPKSSGGKGITVGVLDCGFRGYRDHVGSALPKGIRTQSFRGDQDIEAKDSLHGVLCAEVIHSIAPQARIVLANWEPDEPESFLQAVRWCRDQGAMIVTCSVVMPGWSDGQGGGETHLKLAKALGPAIFFASAGNLAKRQWQGTFRNGADNCQEWRPGLTVNRLTPWGTHPVSIELRGDADSTYRIVLNDDLGHELNCEQRASTAERYGTTLRFQPVSGRGYQMQVKLIEGPGGPLRLIVLGAELEIAAGEGMVFPGDGRDIITVGAIDAKGQKLSSSCFGETDRKPKPDCFAVVPFESRVRAQPFTGTSAAAPQAAGLAARLWSEAPAAASDDIRRKLLKAMR